MKALILNYVSQIDRLFTLEEMLQATGLTRADAIEHWHALLNTGQVYEVRGAHTPHFKYREVPFIQLIDFEQVQAVVEIVEKQPGISVDEIAQAIGCEKLDVERCLKHLRGTSKVEERIFEEWFGRN